MGYAFFDFDKTVIHGDAGPQFGWWLFHLRRARTRERHRRGVAAAKRGAMWARLVPFVSWMTVQSSFYRVGAVRRSTIVRNAYRGLKGVPVAPLDELMTQFAQEHLRPLVYPQIVAEMQAHIDAGRRCVIITTGMERLVEKCLPFLPGGVELLGCRLEERRGRLTGRVVSGPLYGADKANILLAYCRVARVDPEDCYAYTDHYSDKHMLEAVGHGVTVNPRRRLRRLAQERGWRILDLPRPAAAGGSDPPPATG